MKVVSPLDGGGQEVILTLIQGVQLYFKAYFANFRTPVPDNYCTVPKRITIIFFMKCFFLFIDLSKPLFQFEAAFKMN